MEESGPMAAVDLLRRFADNLARMEAVSGSRPEAVVFARLADARKLLEAAAAGGALAPPEPAERAGKAQRKVAKLDAVLLGEVAGVEILVLGRNPRSSVSRARR